MTSTIRHSLINSHCTDYSADAKRVMDDWRKHTPREILSHVKTDFIGATDTEGSHYSAQLPFNNYHEAAYVPADYSLTTPENHLAAAVKLISLTARDSSYELLSYESDPRTSGYWFTFRLV